MLACGGLPAQVPGILNYQGRLAVSGTNFTGTAQFKFALVDAAGDTAYWCHNGTSSAGGEPSGPAIPLAINNGLFSVNLGDLTVSNMAWSIPAGVFTNPKLYLRVWVHDLVRGSQLLSPDQRITAVGYAMVAQAALGPVADSQLSANIARLNGNQVFGGTNTFSSVARLTNTANVLVGTHVGDGSGLVNLAASNLSGSVPRSTNFSGTLAGDVTGTQNATVVGSVGGASAAYIVLGAKAANSASSANSPAAIVLRDDTGGFAAGTINATFAGDGSGLTALNAANLNGTVPDGRLSANVALLGANQSFAGTQRLTNTANVLVGAHAGDGSGLVDLTAANLKGSAPSAVNFTGPLAGDVTGSQGGTVVGSVGGVTAANLAAGANAANGATSANIPNAIVKRDEGGSFAAGTVSGAFVGDGGGLTGLNAANLTGTVADGRLSAAMNSGATAANAATSANNPGTVVKRDSGGNFSAGAINANTVSGVFVGDGSRLTGLNAADLTGTVADGSLSAAMNSGVTAANAATSANAAGTIVKRDSNGSFSAGAINANTVSGVFVGDGSRLTGLNAAGLTGTVADGSLSAAMNSGATAANAANSANAAGTIVKRDSNGSFSAGAITASTVSGVFVGDGSGLTGVNAANLTGQLPARVVQSAIPSGMTVVSTLAQDSGLTAQGYLPLMTIPAPAWTTSLAGGAPSARYNCAGVWTGQALLLWGGTVGGGDSASGGAYRPDQDTWQTIPTQGAPDARSQHSAVWSGQEMIIWGGTVSGTPTNTGGRFNPLNLSWVALPTSGGPAGRFGHVAVWTGPQMLIWGGRNSSGLLSDGALYDPVANQWTALALPNAPSPRFGAAAVWTGDRLLVWGGENQMGGLSTGAQLTFNANGQPSAWVPMSTTGVPQGGSAGAAVWTGHKLLVWGGQSSGAFLGGGGAYDPVADSWTLLNSTGAPSQRSGQSGVWTGQEFLIFGGQTASGTAGDGAAYNPATDTWRPLSRAGSPSARTGPVAAWSGTELVLFGGLSDGLPLASLQRLNPQPTWYFYRKL